MIKIEKTLKTSKMSHGAYAIAFDDELGTVFIENACPEDELAVEVYDKRKDFAYAEIKEVLQASDLRESEAPCKIHKICGSCQWQHISYAEQLKFKRQNLIDQLKQSDIQFNEVPDLIGMDEPWNYRNKIIYPVKTIPSTGRLTAGYFKRKSNELINIKYCPIQYHIFDEIMEAAKNYCSEHGVNSEFLRHILMRSNIDHSEVLVSFILRKKGFNKDKKKLVNTVLKRLCKQFPQIVTTTINYNDNSTNVILGKETEIITGPGYIVENFGELKLEISTTSFFQVNHKQFLKIIELISTSLRAKRSNPDHASTPLKLLDAYCGIGTISLSLAKSIQDLEITGIEEVEAAIENAKRNAELNDIKNTEFIWKKLEDSQIEAYDIVILNPPRKGCTNKVLDAVGKQASPEIIYVSCNPATLCRDIKHLETYGYKLTKIQAVDMFPHSFHFETVAFLSRESL